MITIPPEVDLYSKQLSKAREENKVLEAQNIVLQEENKRLKDKLEKLIEFINNELE